MSPILGIWASSSAASRADTGAMFPLQVITVGPAGASSVSFTNIPGTYSHLQIRYISRNANNGEDATIVRFNSDTGSNYAWHQLRGDGASATAAAVSSTTRFELPFTSYNNATANVFGGGVLDVLDYANTNKYKTSRGLGGADFNGSGKIFFVSGLWMNTSAVTSITITAGSGNIGQYSQFALYGIKGA